MARGSAGRVEAITRADARTRLKTARMYLTAAELAGIAAADAICAHASGERYRGPDHRAAADHLERVTGDAGHYGVSNVTRTNATKALRRATRLVDAATTRVR